MGKLRPSSPQTASSPQSSLPNAVSSAAGDLLNDKFKLRSRSGQHKQEQQQKLDTAFKQAPEIQVMNGFTVGTPPGNNLPTSPSANLLTPLQNSKRRTSGEQFIISTRNNEQSPQSNGNAQNAPSSPLSSNTENAQWSSAVGHATTAGKSGRVIEKLMGDNDRLKRELKEQQIKTEELQRSMQMMQPRIQTLQTENDNLSHARGVDQSLIARRDRQIKEMKDKLELESERREAMEQRAQALQMQRDEAVEEKNRELQNLTESTKRATVHSDILEKSHIQLAAEYRMRVGSMKNEIETLQSEKQEDRQRLSRLDVVSEQIRQEYERTRKVQVEFVAKWEELRGDSKQRLDRMEEETSSENAKIRKLSTEMDEVVKRMRWVMGVKQNTSLDGSSGSA